MGYTFHLRANAKSRGSGESGRSRALSMTGRSDTGPGAWPPHYPEADFAFALPSIWMGRRGLHQRQVGVPMHTGRRSSSCAAKCGWGFRFPGTRYRGGFDLNFRRNRRRHRAGHRQPQAQDRNQQTERADKVVPYRRIRTPAGRPASAGSVTLFMGAPLWQLDRCLPQQRPPSPKRACGNTSQ